MIDRQELHNAYSLVWQYAGDRDWETSRNKI